MNKRINRLTGGLIATAAAGAAVVSMTTTAAHAATTFTPSGGPNANFVASRTVGTSTVTGAKFTDIPAGQALTCTGFGVSGSIVNPGVSRLYGANAGNLSSLSATGCTNPLAGATTVTPVGTWGVTVTGDAVSGLWPAKPDERQGQPGRGELHLLHRGCRQRQVLQHHAALHPQQHHRRVGPGRVRQPRPDRLDVRHAGHPARRRHRHRRLLHQHAAVRQHQPDRRQPVTV
ncbi:hypothetical protein G5V59_11945 [Nocardioides sp. W3-2-3]|uniref:hypothetical protein n=1 Tax=Nocardioides convexus TaxID=2712224 RepID=UPI002418A016|nr:hypothetical protein [Nocardioides convexus]NHA00502.1 hypothetical protein [Nocardioides convexus]